MSAYKTSICTHLGVTREKQVFCVCDCPHPKVYVYCRSDEPLPDFSWVQFHGLQLINVFENKIVAVGSLEPKIGD